MNTTEHSLPLEVIELPQESQADFLRKSVRAAYLGSNEVDYRSVEWIHREQDIAAFELVQKYLRDSVGQKVYFSDIAQILIVNSPTLQALQNTRRKRTIGGKGISSFKHIDTVFRIAVGRESLFIDSEETADKLCKEVVKYYTHDMGKFFIRRPSTVSELAETPEYQHVVGDDTTTIHARSSGNIFEGVAEALNIFSPKEIKRWVTAIQNHHGLEMVAKGFLEVHELAQKIEGSTQEFFELTAADMGGAFGSFRFIPENVQELMKLAQYLAEQSEDVNEFRVLYVLLVKTLLPQLIRSVSEYMDDIGAQIDRSIGTFKNQLEELGHSASSILQLILNILNTVDRIPITNTI